jgi:CRP-like cAMP-binding protein
MSKTQKGDSLPGNRLLALLPTAEFNRLFPDPRPMFLDFKQVLYEPESIIDFAYFPSDGVISQVTVMEDGGIIELSTVGNEGMVGLPLALGIAESSSKAVVQVPLSGLRISADKLKSEMSRDTPLRKLLLRYAGTFLFQISQAVACNGLHSVQHRCCRWLLMTHDRVEGDEFPITHEFLAQMLGVRRPSVTDVLRPLRQHGLIRYHRGRMVILDRKGVEDASCECYRTVRREYARIFAPH